MLSREEIERYSRTIRIDKIGLEGQEKIKSSSVVVVGAGGLGNAILLYLVASGIGRIGVIEGDVVNLSNLGRQVLFSTDDIKKEKSIIVKEKLEKLNPNVEIEIYNTWLTDVQLAQRIFKRYDLIIDATDNFETRYIINKGAVYSEKPLFIGAVGRFVGQVFDVMPYETACLNCVFPEKEPEFIKLMSQRNLEQGVSPPLVGTIGTIVANECLKHILKIGESLFNKLLIYDSLSNEFSIIQLERNKNCKVCGHK